LLGHVAGERGQWILVRGVAREMEVGLDSLGTPPQGFDLL